MNSVTPQTVDKVARILEEADALLISAGAGMGVDSGLPDYRGSEGFWRAYPPLAKLGIEFERIAYPGWFDQDPSLAWGFYGHCLNLYRSTEPHAGYSILRRWAEAKPAGYFVHTSNVDSQFERAGFAPERIAECHGRLNFLQCTTPCCWGIWPIEDQTVAVDDSLRAQGPLPLCPACGRLARPNVLMFDDNKWVSCRTDAQETQLRRWLEGVRRDGARLTVIECGAGRAVPTVRWFSDLQTAYGATLVRINPRDTHVPDGAIALPLGALDALTRINAVMGY